MDTLRLLDILGFVVGLVYLYLEYRASIWLWLASMVMPAIDMVLYYRAGLYADFGMAIYYCLAAVYGVLTWNRAKQKPTPNPSPREGDLYSSAAAKDCFAAAKVTEHPSLGEGLGVGCSGDSGVGCVGCSIAFFPLRLVVPVSLIFLALWAVIGWFLSTHTNSTVPVTDAFTTAMSIVALWALARKYVEQWLLWLVVDAICCILYVYKGIPFKACIYAIYTVFAIFGYRKWRSMAKGIAAA